MNKWQLLIVTLVSIISYLAVRLVVGLALPLLIAYILFLIIRGN